MSLRQHDFVPGKVFPQLCQECGQWKDHWAHRKATYSPRPPIHGGKKSECPVCEAQRGHQYATAEEAQRVEDHLDQW